jgi:hypothetical protein
MIMREDCLKRAVTRLERVGGWFGLGVMPAFLVENRVELDIGDLVLDRSLAAAGVTLVFALEESPLGVAGLALARASAQVFGPDIDGRVGIGGARPGPAAIGPEFAGRTVGKVGGMRGDVMIVHRRLLGRCPVLWQLLCEELAVGIAVLVEIVFSGEIQVVLFLVGGRAAKHDVPRQTAVERPPAQLVTREIEGWLRRAPTGDTRYEDSCRCHRSFRA